MPIYEYKCVNCETKFEKIRSIKDSDSAIDCPKCNSPETKRMLSVCFSQAENSSSGPSSGCGGCSGGSCSGCSH